MGSAKLASAVRSEWQQRQDEQNRRSLQRLFKRLPETFPKPVLDRALARPFIPPTPRLAINSYWSAHPLRAERLSRALARRSGAPLGWTWKLGKERDDGLAVSFRSPPTPYRERAYSRGPGACCICGQPVYRFGWHSDLWGSGVNKNAAWHCACVTAWEFWNAPNTQVRLLRRLQSLRCGASGRRLWKDAQVDHRVPLFEVWQVHRERPWPDLLAYWGLPNLQVINLEVHIGKSADETRQRHLQRAVK
jgi:hypothetical protein